MISIDITKAFPAARCRSEPLRTEIETVPESRPMMPAEMCIARSGNRMVLLSRAPPPTPYSGLAVPGGYGRAKAEVP
jgi:hypothetical protein